MPAAFDGSWSRHSCWLANRISEEHPDWVRVVDETPFYSFMWTRERLAALFEESHPMPEGACSVHLWSHLWWEERRLDFLRFNGERLTPRFIRKGSTTYAREARVFLPPRARGRFTRFVEDASDLLRETWARREVLRRFRRAVSGGTRFGF